MPKVDNKRLTNAAVQQNS